AGVLQDQQRLRPRVVRRFGSLTELRLHRVYARPRRVHALESVVSRGRTHLSTRHGLRELDHPGPVELTGRLGFTDLLLERREIAIIGGLNVGRHRATGRDEPDDEAAHRTEPKEPVTDAGLGGPHDLR